MVLDTLRWWWTQSLPVACQLQLIQTIVVAAVEAAQRMLLSPPAHLTRSTVALPFAAVAIVAVETVDGIVVGHSFAAVDVVVAVN